MNKMILATLLCFSLVFGVTHITDCATLDISGETYILDNDITTTGDCMVIGADDVTLDCEGHSITGPVGDGYAIRNILVFDGNFSVHNCTIVNFNWGIWYGGLPHQKFDITDNLLINQSITGIDVSNLNNSVIKNNIVENSGVYGISIDNIYNTNLTNNYFLESGVADFDISSAIISDFDYCNAGNIIENNTGSGFREIVFVNSQQTISDSIFSLLILCNASGSILDNITIDGSDIKDNNWLWITNTNNITIKNSNFSNNNYGIYVSSEFFNNSIIVNSSFIGNDAYGFGNRFNWAPSPSRVNISFINNTFYNNRQGIALDGYTDCLIKGNDLSHNSLGAISIGYRYTYRINIENNTINDNNYGVMINSMLHGFQNHTIHYNIFSRNNISTIIRGQVFSQTGNNNISNNLFNQSKVYDLQIQNNKGNLIETNSIISCLGTSIYLLSNANDNQFINNTLYDNTRAFDIHDSDNLTIYLNNITYNRNALFLDNSNDNNITNNTIERNWVSGIAFRPGCESSLVENNRICYNGPIGDVYLETNTEFNDGENTCTDVVDNGLNTITCIAPCDPPAEVSDIVIVPRDFVYRDNLERIVFPFYANNTLFTNFSCNISVNDFLTETKYVESGEEIRVMIDRKAGPYIVWGQHNYTIYCWDRTGGENNVTGYVTLAKLNQSQDYIGIGVVISLGAGALGLFYFGKKRR